MRSVKEMTDVLLQLVFRLQDFLTSRFVLLLTNLFVTQTSPLLRKLYKGSEGIFKLKPIEQF